MTLPGMSAVMASAAVESAEEVAAWTKRLAAADDAAWTEAHRRYAPRLLRYLIVATHGDEQAARDALQGAFVRAVRNARVFQTEEAFWGWLTLLARHALADARRSSSRWRSFLMRFGADPGVPDPPAPVDDVLPDLLRVGLAALPEADRSVLEQKYLAAASVREIAEAAGTTEKAIESRLTRARGRLREIILHQLRS
jgi:RNA polymerase sigma-70 factor (ECF subfamily)